MATSVFNEASNRFSAPSSFDFTNSGANTETTLQAVKLDSNGKVTPATAASDKIIGIIMNCPVVGDTADVFLVNNMGTGKVQSGAAITGNDFLTVNSSGLAVTATQTAGGSQPAVHVFGQAVNAASASGQVVQFISMNFWY